MSSWLLEARDAETPDEKLRRLLEAWRHRPLVRTARSVIVLSRRVARRPGERSGEQETWLGLERARDVRDVDWLLSTVACSSRDTAMARVSAVSSWPPDPRIATGLLMLIPHRPLSSVPNRPFWTAVFREVRARMDRSTLPTIEHLLDGNRGASDFDSYAKAKLASLKKRLSSMDALEEYLEESPVLDQIEATLVDGREVSAEKTEQDFLAEIYARPNDDGPREVFADWLIERGDLRGELIALQMKRSRGEGTVASQRRESILLRGHARAWMGPLAPAVHATKFRFERGFLGSCTVKWRSLLTTPGLIQHLAWATVRDFEIAPEGEADCDAWIDHMIALGAKRR